jgi:hypothetical protein
MLKSNNTAVNLVNSIKTQDHKTMKVYFKDLTETQKQLLADRLLADHPMRLQNTLVEYVLQKSYEDTDAPFSFDDITNYNYTGIVELSSESNLELTEEERNEKLEELQDLICDLDDETEQYDIIANDIELLESMDFDIQPEIYQWFSCDDYLLYKLEKHGQCTLDREFWGRQCCGQSVTLDYIIQLIAFESFCDYGCDYLTKEQIEAL